MIEKNEIIEMIQVESLVESPTNPRQDFDELEQSALMRSIEALGIQQALVVRTLETGKFEIVAGERRWRAAKELGLRSVPCVVRDLTDEEVLEIQLVENVQRVGLSIAEECAGVDALEERGMDATRVAEVTGKDVEWVQDRMDFKLAPAALREAVGSGFCGIKSVRSVLRVQDSAEREQLSQEILDLEEPLSDREVEVMIFERYEKPRANLEGWKTWVLQAMQSQEFEGVKFLDDPGTWAQYVRPYGEAVSPFKLETDRVGGLAARDEDAGVQWGQLAKVHGVPLLVVPVGGFQDGGGNVVRVVDRAPIEAAERARKDAGESYTLGAKVRKGIEAKPDDQDFDVEEKGFELVTRESDWNPWLLVGADLKTQAARLAVDVLDCSQDWRQEVESLLGLNDQGLDQFIIEETETILPVVVWYLLHGVQGGDRRGIRLASSFGVREIWEGRVL